MTAGLTYDETNAVLDAIEDARKHCIWGNYERLDLLRRAATKLRKGGDPLARQLEQLQGKALKQRQEIARLTRLVEQLQADKAALRFDLHKAQVALSQKGGE